MLFRSAASIWSFMLSKIREGSESKRMVAVSPARGIGIAPVASGDADDDVSMLVSIAGGCRSDEEEQRYLVGRFLAHHVLAFSVHA